MNIIEKYAELPELIDDVLGIPDYSSDILDKYRKTRNLKYAQRMQNSLVDLQKKGELSIVDGEWRELTILPWKLGVGLSKIEGEEYPDSWEEDVIRTNQALRKIRNIIDKIT